MGKGRHAIAVLVLFMGFAGCRGPAPRPRAQRLHPVASAAPLQRFGYTIQAGAFAKVENAARLAARLQAEGLPATYMPTPSGLYRVRFGDFRTRDAARQRAEALKASGIIDVFWVVSPEEQPAARMDKGEVPAFRRGLLETARSFLGVPYLWGGSTEKGFDCSGFAMAVYQLNGLKLPRSSQAQCEAGRPVAIRELQVGDLVFFSMNGGSRASHVGVYAGDGKFIHAPKRGRNVCMESLAGNGFREHFLGGRSYV